MIRKTKKREKIKRGISMTQFNEDDVRATYRFLAHKDETEIRVCAPVAKSYFVHTEDEFVSVCRELNGKQNVYVGINERVKGGTKDNEVCAVRAVVLDIDAVRAEGFAKEPATDMELLAAGWATDKIINHFLGAGWTPPVKCMSGNGYQLWSAIREIAIIESEWEDTSDRIKWFNKQVIDEFSRDDAKIDNIGNLSRIIKVIGTMSVKGKEKEDRPYRLSHSCADFKRVENGRLRSHILSLEPVLEKAGPEIPVNNNKIDNDVIRSLIDTNPTLKRAYYDGIDGDRSKTDFILCCKLLKCNVPRHVIYNIIMNRPNGKARSHSRPEWYVERTIEKATESVRHG